MRLHTQISHHGLRATCLSLLLCGSAWAQTAPPAEEPPIEDVVVSEGTRNLGSHDGMDAFFKGDFETAEIEFEREFKSLRRFQSARENAAIDADLSADRAAAVGEFANSVGASVSSPGGAVQTPSTGAAANNTAISSNFVNRRDEGRSILTDGEITYQDFAFTRYMTGLSEIKLGKYAEAKKSLKSSLYYDDSNYDARKRLGMLHILEDDFEGAADHLEKLDKLRRKCNKKSCDDQDQIRDATRELAQQINAAASAAN
jgi:tetratricopeptide (TPR) repeat protein